MYPAAVALTLVAPLLEIWLFSTHWLYDLLRAAGLDRAYNVMCGIVFELIS